VFKRQKCPLPGSKLFVFLLVYLEGSISHYTILKAAQTLSAADVVVPLQGTADLTVDGAHTALTFESLDTSVATVDLERVEEGKNQ
jgi:nicotinate-nucleotide pyrophosphorylase